jgi:heme-degrading monooxygenase HmoA
LVAGPGQTEAMSVVKINAITIPEGMGPQLEGRFAGRAKMVEAFEGFEDFQLLRPTEGEDRYFVYTRWASEENFQAWMNSQDFSKGHGTGQADGEQARKPVAQGADLMSFIVVEHVVKGA